MATKKPPKPTLQALPALGDVLAIPLENGFWGACWVARIGKRKDLEYLGPHVVISSADWFDTQPPTLKSLGEPKLLQIDHSDYNEPAAFNLNEPLPVEIKVIGQMVHDVATPAAPWVSGWARIIYQMQQQRVWNVDRGASALAYENQKAEWARANAKSAAKNNAERLSHLKSLRRLRKIKFLFHAPFGLMT
jgi:hypothetical protein